VTPHMTERVAKVLGWTEAEVQSFSLPTLREVVRRVSPKLAYEITQVMRGPDYYLGTPLQKRRRRT